jgi:hypothetical protein
VKNPILMPLQEGQVFILNLIDEPRGPAERDLGKLRQAAENGLVRHFQVMPYSAANP